MGKITMTEEYTQVEDMSLMDALSLAVSLIYQILDKVEDSKTQQELKLAVINSIESEELVQSGMPFKDIKKMKGQDHGTV